MIKAELLRDADDSILKGLIFGPQASNWVFQEKHNGDRRLIEKRGDGQVRDFNREGEPGKGLPKEIIAAIKQHPLHQFVIDVELVKNRIFIFDILFAGDEICVTKPYSYREACYHAQFDGYDDAVTTVWSARTPEEKVALVQQLKLSGAEGLCAKELTAAYRPSDHNQRWNYRYKFWKTLDAVVLGDSTKVVKGKLRDSVRLGLYMPNGSLKDICGATKKSAYTLKRGDVVEVKYLYGTGTLDIVQIDILSLRTDKAAKKCTIDQIEVNKNWRDLCSASN